MVSAPSTMRPGWSFATAAALRRAFSVTMASGAPALISGASATVTSKGMPMEPISSLRRGDPDAKINGSVMRVLPFCMRFFAYAKNAPLIIA